MPNWKDVLVEIKEVQLLAQQEEYQAKQKASGAFDTIRRKYLDKLHQHTGRNVIAYYSAWQSKSVTGTEINDEDRNGFMMALHGVECKKGLDIILHTPGGSISATQSIVNYLRDKFGKDIRVVIPHTAMSAGTIIACSSKEIHMAKHSSIGPIDPQIGGLPASGLLNEFERAYREIKEDPAKQYVWLPILQKYNPTLLGHCQNAIDWSEKFAREQLESNMFSEAEEPDKTRIIDQIISRLTEYDEVKAHERQINHREGCDIGLNIKLIEENQEFQDLILTVHHCYMHTISHTNTLKIIENHLGTASINQVA